MIQLSDMHACPYGNPTARNQQLARNSWPVDASLVVVSLTLAVGLRSWSWQRIIACQLLWSRDYSPALCYLWMLVHLILFIKISNNLLC